MPEDILLGIHWQVSDLSKASNVTRKAQACIELGRNFAFLGLTLKWK
jgi:hypothetical protein